MRMKRLSIVFVSIIMIASVVYAGSIENASQAQRNLIQSALGDQYPISKIAVIKSGNHSKAFYVGAIFNAEGVGDVFGIWLVGGDKDKPSLVYSVNGAAHQFSGMRKASETKAAAYIHDPESKALTKYFGK
jgi:hypothetical protein